MTAHDEYFRYNKENLQLPTQIQLSKKLKTFCCIFTAFLKSTLSFEHFEKNENKKKSGPHRLSIFEIIDSERHNYLNT